MKVVYLSSPSKGALLWEGKSGCCTPSILCRGLASDPAVTGLSLGQGAGVGQGMDYMAATAKEKPVAPRGSGCHFCGCWALTC